MSQASLLRLVAVLVFTPTLAFAYFGPGPGISAFGSLLALLAAIGLAIVGFVWYPVRRLLRRVRSGKIVPGE